MAAPLLRGEWIALIAVPGLFLEKEMIEPRVILCETQHVDGLANRMLWYDNRIQAGFTRIWVIMIDILSDCSYD